MKGLKIDTFLRLFPLSLSSPLSIFPLSFHGFRINHATGLPFVKRNAHLPLAHLIRVQPFRSHKKAHLPRNRFQFQAYFGIPRFLLPFRIALALQQNIERPVLSPLSLCINLHVWLRECTRKKIRFRPRLRSRPKLLPLIITGAIKGA